MIGFTYVRSIIVVQFKLSLDLCSQQTCATIADVLNYQNFTMFSLRNRICVICAAISVLLSIDAFFTPSFDVDEHLIFRLYTPDNQVEYQKLKTSGLSPISSTSFDPRIPTRIFVHGFKSKEKTIGRYKDVFSKIGNYNFIGVDWISGASTYNYLHSKGLVPLVCRSY